jgi:DNA-binding MarR family transcriptional regulator
MKLHANHEWAGRECIGIDDGWQVGEPGLVTDDAGLAGEFERLFRAVYLTFHRRDAPRSQMASASLAVLEHLALAGPVTIGEAAAHLRRAQSVVSEIVAHLERQGLLEREADPADRRRTLVWLTLAGQAALRRQREVLSEELLARALERMPPEQVGELLGALRALVRSATPAPAGPSEGNPS